MIEAQSLSLEIGGTRILSEVSAVFPRGQITVILGPNGAGKSSLIKLLAGLVTPTHGQALINDAPILQLLAQDRARKIGYLAQNATPAWAMRVDDLVAIGRLPHESKSKSMDRDQIEAAMRDCDITQLADRTIDTLSGGELARVLFARVLAGEPDWLLVDEPIANLDPLHERETLRLLKKSREAGRSVITILHQINAAAAIADRIIFLKAGRIIATGPVVEALTCENLEAVFDIPFTRIADGKRGHFVPEATL